MEPGRFEISTGRGPTHWLAIKDITMGDAGRYSCIAENSKGTAWCVVNVQVHDGTYDVVPREYQEAPLFTMKPKSSRVVKGSDCLIRDLGFLASHWSIRYHFLTIR